MRLNSRCMHNEPDALLGLTVHARRVYRASRALQSEPPMSACRCRCADML